MENVLEELKSAQTPNQAEQIVNKYYPNWIILALDSYSTDYPHLQQNWEKICQKLNTTPKKIVLVDHIVFEDNPNDINKICEFMTHHGYVVRRSTEFLACQNCEKAIPCEEIWHLLKEKNFPVPKSWKNHCTNCSLRHLKKYL